MFRLFLLTIFLLRSTVYADDDYAWEKGLNWQHELDEAKELAQYHKKPIFLFLESRTCFYCPKLRKPR